jgi:hypothetical protein
MIVVLIAVLIVVLVGELIRNKSSLCQLDDTTAE